MPQKADAWAGSYSLANTGGTSPRGTLCDTFNASGIPNGTNMTVTLTRGSMRDAYVYVFRPDGTVAAADDDSAGNLNSRLTTTWYNGYYIGATTYSSESTGVTYTLTVSTGTWTRGSATCNVPPKSNQTITFDTPVAQTFRPSGTFTVSASATSGLPVSFASSTTSVCTVSGATVTMQGAGTCTLTASQSGSTNWNPASNVVRSFAINKANQSITFGALSNRTYSATPFPVSATASSGLVVSFASQTTSTCSVSNTDVTMLAAGTCTIRALQSGNANYNGASIVDQSFVISKANQTITFANPGTGTTRRFGTTFITSGSSSSTMAVTFTSRTTSTCTTSGTNGTTISLINTGTCTLRASQAGDTRFNAATDVDQTFTIEKALQSITFATPVDRTYGDGLVSVTATSSAPSSANLTVSFESLSPTSCAVSGSSVSILGAGTCTLRASQAGNALYESATPVDRSFTINRKVITAPNASVASRVYNGTNVAGSVTVGALVGVVSPETLNVSATGSDYASPNVTQGGVNFFAVQRSSSNFATGKGVEITSSTSGLCASSVKAQINDSWGSGGPGGTCAADYFSTYYDAQLTAPATGTYTFYASTDDGFYLTVNGTPVIDSWVGQGAALYNASGTYAMTANLTYRIRVWQFEGSGGAAARLFWKLPGSSNVSLVPASAFYEGRPTTVTFTLADGTNGGRASNYEIAPMTLSGAITPRPLIISANNLSRVTSDPAPSFNLDRVVVDGLAPNETLSNLTYNFRLATSSGSFLTDVPDPDVVATHTVLPSGAGLSNSRPLSNYEVTYAPGTYTINTGAATKLSVPAFNSSTSRVSGSAFGTQPVVTIQDAKGNTVTSGDASTAVVTATLTNGLSGELVGSTTATAVQGVARFTNLGIRGLTSESYEITYSASYTSSSNSVDIAGVAKQTASVTHGAATSVRVVQSASGARSALAFTTQPQIEIVDVKGNRVTTGTGATSSVTVSLTGTGATLSGTATRSATSGLLTFSGLTLTGTAQATDYDLVFASPGLTSAVQEDLPLTAGNASRLTLLRPSVGTASGLPFTTAPQVSVLDAQGNSVSNVSTTVTATLTRVNNTGSLVNGSSATTATASTTNGIATFTNLGITGLQNTSYPIVYSATGLTSVRQDVTVSVGPAASLRIDTQAAGATSRIALTTQPKLTVLDSGGNVVTAGADQGIITVTATQADNSSKSAIVTSETATTVNGVAQFSGLTLRGEATTYTLMYSFSNGSQSLSTTGTVVLAAGAASKLAIERASSETVVAGVAFERQPIIRVTDADNNLVSTSTASITATLAGPGTLSGTSTVNAVGGKATFSGLNIRGTAGISAYDLTFTTTQQGISSVVQGTSITVTHGAANKVVVSNASAVTTGTAQSGQEFGVEPVIQIQDAWGNKVTTGVWSEATVSASSTTGSTRVGVTSASAVGGEYTFSTLGLRGVAGTTYTLTYSASASGNTLATTGTHNVTVSSGPAAKVGLLRVSAGNSSGVVFGTQPQVQLLDADNNRVTTSGVVIQAALSSTANGGLIASTNEAITESGVATFSGLGISGRAGSSFTINYRVANSNLTAASQSITLVAGNPTALGMVTNSSSSLKSGSTFLDSPVVKVVDAYGNSVSTNSTVVTAEIQSGNGSVIGTTTRTTTSGQATFTGLGIRGVVGSYTLKFTAAGLTEVVQPIAVTLSHGAAAMLVVKNKDALEAQSNVAASGAAFTTQPVIEVRDISGNLVTSDAGATASVSVSVSTGSSLILQGVTANAVGGVATFTGVGIDGRDQTSYTLTYRSTVGSTALTPATHSVTASVGSAKKLSLAQPAVGTASSEVFTTQPQVRLLDSGNNFVSSSNISVTASITQINNKGELFSASGLSASTNASGVATFSGVGIKGVAGTSYTVTYASSGLTSVTQSIRVSPGVAASTSVNPSPSLRATGGTVSDITINGQQWRVHRFTSTGASSFVISSDVSSADIEYLIVGGGGGGGYDGAGGGGGGQVRTGTTSLAPGTHSVVVGAGGGRATTVGSQAGNGSASRLGNLEAIGGGGGGSKQSNGADGGSGGGGGHDGTTRLGGAGSANTSAGIYGNSGGRNSVTGGGGGGGAGAAGSNASTVGGKGGDGISSSITGVSAYYGGGGGGGNYSNSGGAGGSGGGGKGGDGSGTTSGVSGSANTGGGGGATGNISSSATAGNGGSGVVIIRYRINEQVAASGVVLDPQPRVEVKDIDGNLVDTSSELVTVSLTRASADGNTGELIGNTQVRAVNGVATFTDLAILGTADRDYELSFSIGDQGSRSAMVYRLQAGEPVALALANSPSTQISGSATSVGLATAPRIQLLDSMGNVTVRENRTINVAVSAGGSLSGTTTATTGSDGIAELNSFTVGARAGTYTLTFSSTGLQPVSHIVTAVAGTASKIVVDSSVATIRAGSGNRFNIDGAVRVTDAAGNTVTTSSAAITATSTLFGTSTTSGILSNNGTGSSSTLTVNASSGVVPLSSFALSGTADTKYAITYTGTGLSSANHEVTLTAGVPSQVAVTSAVIAGSGAATSGAALPVQPKLAIRDSSNNLVVTADSTVERPLMVYAKNEAADIPANSNPVLTEFTSGCYGNSVSQAFNNPDYFDFLFDGSVIEGTDCGVENYMTHFSGYIKAPVTGDVTFASSTDDGFYLLIDDTVVINDWEPQGGQDYTSSDGTGVKTVSMVKDAVYRFRAWHYENGGGSLAKLYWSYTGRSITPVPLSAFVVTNPKMTAAITSAPANTAPGTPSVNGGTYELTGTTSVDVVSGVASFTNLGITGPAGTYTITYTWGTITQTQTVTLTHGVATAMVASAPTSTQAGKPVSSSTVTIVDGAGNTVTSAASPIVASLQGSPSGISLRGTTTRGVVNGVATFNDLSLNGTAGNYTLNFAVTGGGLTALTRNIAVVAGDAARLDVVQFDAEGSKKSGELFSQQPQVRVVDAYNNVLLTQPEVRVELQQVEVGGELTGTLSGSDADSSVRKTMTASAVDGMTSFSGIAINGSDGQRYRLSIASDGVSPVTRTFTITTGDPVALRLLRTGDEQPRVGIAMSQQPQVAIIDSGGNVVVDATATEITASIASGATVSRVNNKHVKQTSLGVAEFDALTVDGTASISGTNYTVTFAATYNSVALTPATQSITLFPGSVSSLTVSDIDTRASGDAFSDKPFETTPIVRVIDSSTNTVATQPSTVTASITSCTGPTTLECIDARLIGSASQELIDGQATFTGLGIRGKIGTYTISYTTTVDGAQYSSFHTIAVEGGDPARMLLDQSTLTAQVGATINPVVTFLDSAGNAATTNATVTVSVSQIEIGGAATGSLRGTTTKQASSGVSNFDGNGLNLVGTAGQTYTLTYSASGVASAVQQVTLTPGTAATMDVEVDPAGAVSGSALLVQPRIRLLDIGGNNAVGTPSVVVSVVGAPAPTNPQDALSGTASVAASNGLATFSGLALTGKVGEYTLEFSSSGLTESIVIDLAPGAPSQLTVVRAPTTVNAPSPSGSAFSSQPRVAVTDAQGNVITSAAGSITASLTGGANGSLVGTASAFVEDGLATFNDLGISGRAANNPYTFTFTHSATNLTVTQPVHVAAGPAAQLVLVPQTQTGQAIASRSVGQAFGTQQSVEGTIPRVVVADSGGNTVTTSTATVTATVSNGATLIGTTTKNAVGGVVEFTDLGFVGTNGQTYTITYSSTNLASATESVTATTGAATKLGIARAGARAKTGAPFITQPEIQLLDAGNNPVEQAGVPIAVASSGGILSGTQTLSTNDDGKAVFADLSLLGTLGNEYTLTYSANGLTSTSHDIRVELGDPYKLALRGDVPTVGNAGSSTETQPVLVVQDFGGNLVSSAENAVTTSISRRTSNGQGTLNAGSIVGTNPATVGGVAQYTNFGIVGTAGETYRVTFASSGLQPATLDVGAQVGPASNITVDTNTSGILAPAGDPIATPISVSIRDAGGNVVSTTSDVTASISAGSSISGTTTVAAVDGTATFNNLRVIGTKDSTPTVTFTVLGVGTATMTPTITTGSASKLVPQMLTRTSPSGATFASTIDVRDAGGNLVSTGNAATASITATVTPVEINGAPTGAFVSGIATSGAATGGSRTFTLGLDGTVGVSYVVTYTATIGSGDSAQRLTGTETVTVTEGAPVSISLTRDAQGTASGVAFTTQPLVTLYDSGGNVATQSNLSLSATLANGQTTGSLEGVTVRPFVNGVATFATLGISGVAGEVYDIYYTVVNRTTEVPISGILPVREDVQVSVGPAKALRFVTQIDGVVSGQVFSTQPTVRVVDSGGNTVSSSSDNVTLRIALASDNSHESSSLSGTLFNGTGNQTAITVSAVDGIAQFANIGLRGKDSVSYSLKFEANLSNIAAGVSQDVTPIGGAPSSLLTRHLESRAANSKQSVPSGALLPIQPVIHILDAEGNISVGSNAVVVASVTKVNNTGELIGTTAVSAQNGIATFTDLGLNGTAGQDYVLTYTVEGVPVRTETVTSAVGAPTQLRIVRGASGARAGLTLTTQPQIEILDSGNNRTSSSADVSVSLERVTVGGQPTGELLGTTTIAAVNGVSTFTNVAVGGIVNTSYSLTYSAIVDGVDLLSATESVTPTPGTPVTAAIIRAANEAIVDEVFITQPVIAVKDRYGNVAVDSSDVVTVSVSTGGSLFGQTSRRAVNGRVEFSGLGLRGTVGATYTLSYGLAGYEPQRQSIRVFSGAANRLSISRPASGAASGAAFAVAPQVMVKDAKGNLVFDSSMEITASVRQVGGTGGLVGNHRVSAIGGIATFTDLGLTGLAGTSYEITFEAVGMLPDSQSIAVTVGAPTTVELLRNSIGTAAGDPFTQQPQIVLRDSGGNVVSSSGTEVTATITSGASLVGTTTASTIGGVATFENLGVSGTVDTRFTVTYAVPGVNDTATQSGTVTVGSPRQLSLRQSALGTTVGAVFATQPQIAIRDGAGNTVTGSTAAVTATISGVNGGLSGTRTRNAVQGIATFVDLGLIGNPDEVYLITYASPGLGPVAQTLTATPGQTGLVPIFGDPVSTVDGFRVEITNYDPAFSYTATATNGARVVVTTSNEVSTQNNEVILRGYAIVSGLDGDQTSTVTVTSSRAEFTTVNASVLGRSLKRPALNPIYSEITATNDGFTARINNYNPSYIWIVSLPNGARATIGVSGVMRVTGVAPGTSITATVSTTRPGYEDGRSTTPSVTTLLAGRTPTFGNVTRTDDGFTVQITNYESPIWTWTKVATGSADVNIDGSGLVTVTGLAPGAESTVLIKTSRDGYSIGSASVTGRAISPARTPQFGTETPTATGWTIPITNYDSAFTWTVSAVRGQASLVPTSATTANIMVSNVADDAQATVTVTTTRAGFQSGEASKSLQRLGGLIPAFGVPESDQNSLTIAIENYDTTFTWRVTSTAGVAALVTEEVDGVTTTEFRVTGLQPRTAVTVTASTSRIGYTSQSTSYTFGTTDLNDAMDYLPSVVTPELSSATPTSDGFTFVINNFADYDNTHQISLGTTAGLVTRENANVTVTGLNPGGSAEVTVSVNASGKQTGFSRRTGLAISGQALTPTVSGLTSTADGFTFSITNYDDDYFYLATSTSGAATVSSTGVVTVTGLTPGSSASVTVTAGRSGYNEGQRTVQGTTTLGRALIPAFGLPRATADGFVIPITNYTSDVATTWTVTSTVGQVSTITDDEITVTGLTAGQAATITVSTQHANRGAGSAQFTFAALSNDGVTPGVTQGLRATFGSVTRTLDGFTVPITNFNSAFTWTAISAAGGTASVNTTTGVLTVTGLDAGETDEAVVFTNRDNYGTGNARVTASALTQGTRERNLLTGVSVGSLCGAGSPEGYEVGKVNDLTSTSGYSCFVNDARNIGSYTSSSVGFYTADLSPVVVDRITFTSSQSSPEHDPVTYSLWGCAEENRFCSAIVSNDITNLSTTRGADSVRSIRNTRAFRYYRLTFGSIRGITNSSNVSHSLNIGEVAFNGRSAEQAALTPTLGVATVSDSGVQMQVNNYSSLYVWDVQVPAPGVANISTSGLITVSNFAPNSTARLTVRASRTGYATGETSYSFTTTEGPELRPVLSRPILTADGARVRIENFNVTGYFWRAALGDCSTLGQNDEGLPISTNGLIEVREQLPGTLLTLSVCTSRENYLDGKSVVTFSVPLGARVATFDAPTRTNDGFNVEITNFDPEYSWSVRATNGASVLLENDGVIRVSNLGAGESSTVIVTTTRTGYSTGTARITAAAINAGLMPEFSATRSTDDGDGYEFTITNYDDDFTWTFVENTGASTVLDSASGVVTVSTNTPESSFVTVTTARENHQSASASVGAGLEDAYEPLYDNATIVTSQTGATIPISNFDPAYTWGVTVAPAGQVVFDSETRTVNVSGASPGTSLTVTISASRTGFATGRTTIAVRTDEREGLLPSLAAPIRMVGGFSVDITNFDARFEWTATTTSGTVEIEDNSVIVTSLDPAEVATITVSTSRSGYSTRFTTVQSSALLSPAVVPQFEAPTSRIGGFTTQISNYDSSLTWSASVSQGGTATVSSTGLVTVTGLAGLTTAELVVTSESPSHLTGRASTSGTSLVNPALTPRFGLTESTPDGFRVRISNYDPRWTWTYSVSGADRSNVVIGQDGFVVVSGISGVRFITVTVMSNRAGFVTGAADVSAYSLPEPRITLGAQSVTQYQVTDNGQAILTTATPHGLDVNDVIVVTGISELLDGERTVTEVTTTSPHTLSFATTAPTTPPTQLIPTGSVRLLDDINLEVLMTDELAPIVVRAQINIPFSTADSGTQFTATTMMSEVIDAGYRVVRVRAESETEGRISQLNVPIRILFDPPAEGAVPVYSGDGGETWRILDLLDTPFLPDDREDGYFVSADGRVWVFTRHLSIFGLLAQQAVPITVSSSAPGLMVGDRASVTITGGEGDGEVSARSLTPEVCSLSQDNEVVALQVGECRIEATKAASGRFVAATGTLSLTVVPVPVNNPEVVETPTVDTPAAITPKKSTAKKKKSSTVAVPVTTDTGTDTTDDLDSIDDGSGTDDGGSTDADNQGKGDEGPSIVGGWGIRVIVLLLLVFLGAGVASRRRRSTRGASTSETAPERDLE